MHNLFVMIDYSIVYF